MHLHASCAARSGPDGYDAILLLGPPGAGKSDLLLRLIHAGWALVADDQVCIDNQIASPPAALAGMIEVRGLGLFTLPHLAAAPLRLAVRLGVQTERLPAPEHDAALNLPVVTIDPASASAVERVTIALEAAAAVSGKSPAPSLNDRPRMNKPEHHLRIVLVTGLSGAGKSSILRALEDLDFETMDNPPLNTLEDLVTRSERNLAIGVDARSRGFDADTVLQTIERLKLNAGLHPDLVYAIAEDENLLRRYTETRRRHPLAQTGQVADGIALERLLTDGLRRAADLLIDTSTLPLSALRQMIEQRYGAESAGISIALVSFGYPSGLPREADILLDARFLRNPHYEPMLKPLTGLDPSVGAFIETDPNYAPFFAHIRGMVDFLLPRFVQEGKKYATIAIGCTGGQHRSVFLIERLAAHLRLSGWRVGITHREQEKLSAAKTGDGVRTKTMSSATK